MEYGKPYKPFPGIMFRTDFLRWFNMGCFNAAPCNNGVIKESVISDLYLYKVEIAK